MDRAISLDRSVGNMDWAISLDRSVGKHGMDNKSRQISGKTWTGQ